MKSYQGINTELPGVSDDGFKLENKILLGLAQFCLKKLSV